LELFAKDLYESTNPVTRTELEKNLVQFASSPDCLNKCQLLLERASVSVFTSNIEIRVRKLPVMQSLRNYLRNYA